jgi:hypothetical protein
MVVFVFVLMLFKMVIVSDTDVGSQLFLKTSSNAPSFQYIVYIHQVLLHQYIEFSPLAKWFKHI